MQMLDFHLEARQRLPPARRPAMERNQPVSICIIYSYASNPCERRNGPITCKHFQKKYSHASENRSSRPCIPQKIIFGRRGFRGMRSIACRLGSKVRFLRPLCSSGTAATASAVRNESTAEAGSQMKSMSGYPQLLIFGSEGIGLMVQSIRVDRMGIENHAITERRRLPRFQ